MQSNQNLKKAEEICRNLAHYIQHKMNELANKIKYKKQEQKPTYTPYDAEKFTETNNLIGRITYLANVIKSKQLNESVWILERLIDELEKSTKPFKSNNPFPPDFNPQKLSNYDDKTNYENKLERYIKSQQSYQEPPPKYSIIDKEILKKILENLIKAKDLISTSLEEKSKIISPHDSKITSPKENKMTNFQDAENKYKFFILNYIINFLKDKNILNNYSVSSYSEGLPYATCSLQNESDKIDTVFLQWLRERPQENLFTFTLFGSVVIGIQEINCEQIDALIEQEIENNDIFVKMPDLKFFWKFLSQDMQNYIQECLLFNTTLNAIQKESKEEFVDLANNYLSSISYELCNIPILLPGLNDTMIDLTDIFKIVFTINERGELGQLNPFNREFFKLSDLKPDWKAFEMLQAEANDTLTKLTKNKNKLKDTSTKINAVKETTITVHEADYLTLNDNLDTKIKNLQEKDKLKEFINSLNALIKELENKEHKISEENKKDILHKIINLLDCMEKFITKNNPTQEEINEISSAINKFTTCCEEKLPKDMIHYSKKIVTAASIVVANVIFIGASIGFAIGTVIGGGIFSVPAAILGAMIGGIASLLLSSGTLYKVNKNAIAKNLATHALDNMSLFHHINKHITKKKLNKVITHSKAIIANKKY